MYLSVAAVLEVDSYSVLHALRGLRDEGLLAFRWGRGIRVVTRFGHGAVIA